MAQKYRVPMWNVPDQQNLEDDKSTIKGNSKLFYATKANYLALADDVLERLESL